MSPLASILIDIERAIEARLYYPALLIALTLPDICVTLTLHKSEFTKRPHYIDFLTKYTLGIDDLGISPDECYRLRGGVVHRAHFAGHPDFSATHVVFTIPETNVGVHGPTLVVREKRAKMLDLILFCETMVKAVHLWHEDHKSDPQVAQNMNNLIRYCPEGLPPIIGPAPVVASGT